ncbi:hypothetical protein PC116_g30335 [Phytophthora cactorum]|nr:hypothetical protein PC116_g30335 [Phytophthora cactorum]
MIRKVCLRAIRKTEKVSYQVYQMGSMNMYSQEFKDAFDKLRDILQDPGAGDEGDEDEDGN